MNAVKKIITGPQCLAHFDPKKPIVLLTDASRTGLGYILTQPDIVIPSGTHSVAKIPKGKLITCGSRFLSEAEGNYAVVELELLAIQWAVHKCRLYVAGANFQVITDHQPLIGIMNGKNLDAMQNARIHRLMAKLRLGYTFKVLWTPGKTQCIADALSRLPVFKSEEKPDILVCTVLVGQATTKETLDPALKKLVKYATENAEYQKV